MREVEVTPLAKVEKRFTAWLSREAASQQETEGRKRPPIVPVTLLEINDEEIGFKAWPWSPFDFSLAVHAAVDFQPRLLAIEPLLVWEKANAQQLDVLHRQLLKVPRLVLSATFAGYGQVALVGQTSLDEGIESLRFEGNPADLAGFPEYGSAAVLPEESLRFLGKIGFTSPDSLVERQGETSAGTIPLVYRSGGRLLPSFVLQIAMQLYGVTPGETLVIPGDSIRLGNEQAVPIDRNGGMQVVFGAPLGRLSVSDLLLAAEQQGSKEAAGQAAKVEGSIVLLGRTDSGVERYRFDHGSYSRAEVLAHAAATIQEGLFLRPAPLVVKFALIAVALGVAVWFFRVGKFWSFLSAFGLVAAYGLIALWVASGLEVAMPVVLPAGLLLFILGARQLQ